MQNLDRGALNFLQAFTLKALQHHQTKVKPKKRKAYGLELLYTALLGGGGVEPGVQQRAFDMLVKMLRTSECEGHRKRFMKLCCENLRNGQSVTQSLCLMSDIIGTFDSDNKKKKKVRPPSPAPPPPETQWAEVAFWIPPPPGSADARSSTDARLSWQKVQGREANRRRPQANRANHQGLVPTPPSP